MKIGLNIGSGQRPFKSTEEVKWINVDSQAKWEPDYVCDGAHLDGTDGFTFTDNSVDYVVLHHVLEHFGCGEAEGLIKEAWRVLKPRGSLFVFVPDMRGLATRWIRNEIDTQIYLTNVYGAYMGNEDDRHKWGFEFQSLEKFIYGCASWYRSYAGKCPNLPASADAAHDWWILEMEFVK